MVVCYRVHHLSDVLPLVVHFHTVHGQLQTCLAELQTRLNAVDLSASSNMETTRNELRDAQVWSNTTLFHRATFWAKTHPTQANLPLTPGISPEIIFQHFLTTNPFTQFDISQNALKLILRSRYQIFFRGETPLQGRGKGPERDRRRREGKGEGDGTGREWNGKDNGNRPPTIVLA